MLLVKSNCSIDSPKETLHVFMLFYSPGPGCSKAD